MASEMRFVMVTPFSSEHFIECLECFLPALTQILISTVTGGRAVAYAICLRLFLRDACELRCRWCGVSRLVSMSATTHPMASLLGHCHSVPASIWWSLRQASHCALSP